MNSGEWVTNRSSRTSSDPASRERFTMVDQIAEGAWQAFRRSVSSSPGFEQRTLGEQLKQAFLAGWVGHEHVTARTRPSPPREDRG